MSNRLIVFDCDGTLIDSQANICRAMEDCFGRARLVPPDRRATRRIVGLSLVKAMQALLPDADADMHLALAEDYKLAFQRLRAASGLADEPLYPGIAALLAELDAAGWLLGVATGKSDRGLALCLDHHGLACRFVTLQTADRHPSKPHPSMLETAMAEAGAVRETTLMIGDTRFDMAMGVAAGVAAIGVDWGYHGVAELREAGAAHVLSDARDLPALAERLVA